MTSLVAFLEAAHYLQVPLRRNGVGHFEAAGTLNPRPVRVLADLRLGSVIPRTRGLFAVDLSHVNAALAQKGATPVDVILWVDVFDAQAAVIDYGTASLFLRDV